MAEKRVKYLTFNDLFCEYVLVESSGGQTGLPDSADGEQQKRPVGEIEEPFDPVGLGAVPVVVPDSSENQPHQQVSGRHQTPEKVVPAVTRPL